MPDYASMPVFESFGDVVRWIIEETGAMCPGNGRLAAYAADPQASELSDVRYHVEEARCRLCQVELREMRATKPPV